MALSTISWPADARSVLAFSMVAVSSARRFSTPWAYSAQARKYSWSPATMASISSLASGLTPALGLAAKALVSSAIFSLRSRARPMDSSQILPEAVCSAWKASVISLGGRGGLFPTHIRAAAKPWDTIRL